MGDNAEKSVLIPHVTEKLKLGIVRPGVWRWGCGLSGSWRGNGPPSLRRVAGLRGRPATLELRHGPDTYGWQQSRIFLNGGNPEGATPREGWRSSDRKPLSSGNNAVHLIREQLIVPEEEAVANSVPAAAVIQRLQALFGFIGRKGSAGGRLSRMWNLTA